jgi:hypothetical protein
MFKYPRTHHLQGSRLQPGDEDLDQLPFSALAGRALVVEEKVDGANAAISFAPDGALRLQSRGHYLTGGPRERHFDLFKRWANVHRSSLHAVLGARYVVYGEWLYAKHTMFYDQLPHYFLEFDVLDLDDQRFLATDRRRALLAPLAITPVPVVHAGRVRSLDELTALVGPSALRSRDWRARLAESAAELGLDGDRVARETDSANEMEGLYIKIEEDGVVQARYKWVRASFLTSVIDSGSHWLTRPIVPNRLREGVDIFQSSAQS